jgi:excisionase family DNA binding protein
MSEAEPISITEAAQRLGVSVRTVQRRLDAGTLEAAFEGDARRVMLRDTTRHADATEGDTQRDTSRDSNTPQGDSDATDATFESEGTRHRNATGRQADATQRDREGDTSRDTARQNDTEAARVLAETEAAFLREALEVSRANEAFLRAQVEAANRQAAESAAALREYLKLSAKQLSGGETGQIGTGNAGAQSGLEAAKSGAAGIVSGAAKNAAKTGGKREMRPLWKLLLGLR